MLPLMNCDSMNEPQSFANPSKKRKINELLQRNWIKPPDCKMVNKSTNNTSNINTITNINTIDKITNINIMNSMPRTEDVIINLKVDLLQLYTAQQQSMSVVRNRLCVQCQGKGAASDLSNIHIKSDPNNLTSKCTHCFGRGVFPDEKQFTFLVQGHSHNDRIIFKHEADQKLGHQAGDIVVILNQIPDPQFQREGQHLYIKKEIVLSQALCGGEFYIQHLNGRILKFNTRPGEVLAPYQIKCIPNEGMPYKNDVNRRGHIFVQFEVKFPPQPCNPHLINVLKRFLPTPTSDPLEDIVKKQPNRLVNCEIVDLAYPRPQQQQQNNANNNNNRNHQNGNRQKDKIGHFSCD